MTILVHRVRLTGSRTHVNANNNGANDEPGEPDKMGNPGGSSIWYTWTAPASGRVTLSTNNVPPYLPLANSDGLYGLYRGLQSFSLQVSSCGDAIDQNPPPAYFPVLAAFTGTNVPTLTPANCLPVGLAGYPYTPSSSMSSRARPTRSRWTAIWARPETSLSTSP